MMLNWIGTGERNCSLDKASPRQSLKHFKKHIQIKLEKK